METRTTKQINANNLDLWLSQAAREAERYGYPEVAQAVGEQRRIVRKDMHPEDRKNTSY